MSFPKLGTAEVTFNKYLMFCSFVRHSEFRLSSVLKKIVFLSVAASFLAYCYLRIYYLVRATGNSIINGNGAFTPIRLRREIALLKTMLVIFATFIASYLPLSLIYAIDQKRTFPLVVYFIGVVLLWLSSSVNWLIYYWMNRQYRLAIQQLLCCRQPSPKQARQGVYISTENGSNSVFEVSQIEGARESLRCYRARMGRRGAPYMRASTRSDPGPNFIDGRNIIHMRECDREGRCSIGSVSTVVPSLISKKKRSYITGGSSHSSSTSSQQYSLKEPLYNYRASRNHFQ